MLHSAAIVGVGVLGGDRGTSTIPILQAGHEAKDALSGPPGGPSGHQGTSRPTPAGRDTIAWWLTVADAEVAMGEIRLARVYDEPPHGGRVFLVERLWPRGVRRDAVHLDDWCKDAAPSTELRRWFGHDPGKWQEFRRRYRAELDANPDAVQPLLEAAKAGDVTLLYSSRDREHNNAVALRDYLLAASGR